jgi:hypothetical protein
MGWVLYFLSEKADLIRRGIGLFSPELKSLLIQVITSWQVIVVTVVIILYFSLVSYVAKLYRSPRSSSLFPSKPKKLKETAPAPEPGEEEGAEMDDDELELDDE